MITFHLTRSIKGKCSSHGDLAKALFCQSAVTSPSPSPPLLPFWHLELPNLELPPKAAGGRAGGIRTHDPLPPRQVRYQTALQPVYHRWRRAGRETGQIPVGKP